MENKVRKRFIIVLEDHITWQSKDYYSSPLFFNNGFQCIFFAFFCFTFSKFQKCFFHCFWRKTNMMLSKPIF